MFGGDIYNSTITLKEADKNQSNLLVEILNFRKQPKLKNPEKKMKKGLLENLYNFFKGRDRVLDAFESKIFRIKFECQLFQTRFPTILISKY